jgi:hypothetical protein
MSSSFGFNATDTLSFKILGQYNHKSLNKQNQQVAPRKRSVHDIPNIPAGLVRSISQILPGSME